jgi:hypothetical protein
VRFVALPTVIASMNNRRISIQGEPALQGGSPNEKGLLLISRSLRVLIPALLCFAGAGSVANAQAYSQQHLAPQPLPSASPKAFTWNAQIRAYDFERFNKDQSAANPNRTAFESAVILHGNYQFEGTKLSVGATYEGADPFGVNPPGTAKTAQANGRIDNSLPGFQLSTLDEAYVRYNTGASLITVGDQILNDPWLYTDSRIKPDSYRGLTSEFALSDAWSVGFTRITEAEFRTDNNFGPQNLLTTVSAGGQNPPPGFPAHPGAGGTDGFYRFDTSWHPNSQLTATFDNFQFIDLAQMFYGEGRYNFAPQLSYNPFLRLQAVDETQEGKALAGVINNQTLGFQVGATVAKNLVLTFAGDDAPWHYQTVSAASAAAAEAPYFVSVATNKPGIAQSLGGGLFRVAYGGIASPYTDNYATDPLYTTSLTQGMVDNRAAGDTYKTQLTWTGFHRQLVTYVSEAWYNYSNDISLDKSTEFNADATYYFNRVRASGPYHGFAFRERYGSRTQDVAPFDFKYLRTQFYYSL